MPVILALRRLRETDFETSLGYKARPCLKTGVREKRKNKFQNNSSTRIEYEF